jgi:dTDP-4-dehydrorhamnose 3,5-epimerase
VRLRKTALAGAFVLEQERREDPRGYFARTFCQKELGDAGLFQRLAQCSVSYNAQRGTLRGLHFQSEPHAEEKIVSCIRGAIFDVIVDLRRGSPTFGQYAAEELTPENGYAFYVPKGFAHGFQTLEDGAAVSYMISEFYVPEAARGVRWDDPDVGVPWPAGPKILSERDAMWPTVSEWLRQTRTDQG